MAVRGGGDVFLMMLGRTLLVLETTLFLLAGSSQTEFSDFMFTQEPADIVAVRDLPAMLNCSAQSSADTPAMQWKRDGVFLNLDGDTRRKKLQNGTLYFSNIVHSRSHRPDEGIYQCVASVNNLGSIVSRKAKLQVAYLGKTFTTEPQDLKVHLGAMAMFACHLDGAPKPTVRWYKDEVEINTEHVNYRVHTDGVLEIGNVQSSDLGRYKCRVENIERSRTSRDATLSQDADPSTYQGFPPQFVMRPYDRIAIEGETIMLYCAANGRDRQGQVPTISWLKDGVTIDLSDLDSRFTMVGQGSLQIKDLEEQDSGSYTCRASNLEDSEDADASLSVHVPPTIKKKPRSVFANTNADVEFECRVHGVPKPTIQWMKNGDILVPSDYFQIIDGSHLRILGLVNSDEGLYQCLAENEVGNVQASAQLVILQPDSPLPITSSQLTTPQSRNNHNHHAGSTTDVNAELPSAPTDLVALIVDTRFVTLSWHMPLLVGSSEIIAYSVYWREENSDRERVLNSTSMQANIQHLKPSTKYDFRVLAYNREGPSREAAEITVKTQAAVHVPDRPINVQAHTLSSTSIMVSWDPPPTQTNPITKYRVYYYPEGGQEEQDLDVPTTQHTMNGLKKFTEYNFRVVAYNTNGPGMSTDEVKSRTYSDVPSEPPQNVTLETASSTSIIIHWEPPPEEAQNGIITGYKIRYKTKGRRGDTVTTDGNRRAYALTDLTRGQEYSVRIQAMTVNGSSPATDWLSTETFLHDLDETSPPSMPTSLTVRPMTASIVVSWTPPPSDENIMVRGYILGYGVGIPDVYKQVLEAKQRYFTIKKLFPSSQYVISLRAYNNMGEGRPIYETVVTREETTPEPLTPMIPPVGLKTIVISPTTIVVTWTDTTLGGKQRVTDNRYYTIRYNTRASRKTRYDNSTDLNVNIEDLRPNTEYEFSVKVIKGRRQSTWSLSVFNKTFETAPATAPRDLTCVAVEGKPTWISLNWQPPRTPNGQITGYLVFYTTDATQRDRDWVVEPVMGERLSTVIRDLTPETTYYFKVQARNSKGNGPTSPTVIFRTPRADGTGGGPIETPADYGQPRIHYNNKKVEQVTSNQQNGFPPMVLWIVIGVISGITVIAVIVVSVFVCRKKSNSSDRKRKGGYMPTNKGMMGPKDIKPPDLWIHDMEMKNLDKNNPESTMTVTPIRRKSQDMKGDDDGNNMDKHTEHSYDSLDEERYRRPTRGKPMIMIPVDQPPPPREPIATAIPNGHLVGPDGTSTPIRPVHPRSYGPSVVPPYTTSPPPRVHAGDIGPPPVTDDQHMTTLERRRAKDKHRRHSASRSGPQSPDSPSGYNQHAPIPYEQLPVSSQMPDITGHPEGSQTLPHRPKNPLKSFLVPGPPSQSVPTTPIPKHIGTTSSSNTTESPPIVVTPGSCAAVKPQQQQPQPTSPSPAQQASPYKKPQPPITTSTPSKVRSPLPVVTPKAPDVTTKSGDSTDTELPKSYSAEELSAEMANLEGLMKDLNAITQQEFEC